MKVDFSAEQTLSHAEHLLECRKLDDAVASLNYAESCGAHPDRCSSGRWLAAMLCGDFSAAWIECDAIRRRGAPDPNRFWRGEDIRGKRVILRCLHGFGDAVQFLRFAPMLRAHASKLIVEVPPAMLEIAPCFKDVDEVITWGERAPAVMPEWDVQLEIIELPYLFRTQLDDLPVVTKYLRIPSSVMREVAPRPNSPDNLRVGLVWASGEWNSSRSVPLQLLRWLVHTPGCEFWNLQGGTSREQWTHFATSPASHESYSCCDTILKLAAVIAQLDLVISPDTLAAHLAGALGTPAWIMLEHASDWRWMNARVDSPWYPSLRLFRQPTAGDWNEVVRDVQSKLASLVASSEERLVA